MENTGNFYAYSKGGEGAALAVDEGRVIQKNSFNVQFLHKIHREIS
jgi:hypothetical protein